MANAQRYTGKINRFKSAIERAGTGLVQESLGRGAFSSFECAADALYRGQSETIVANFLADAQQRSEEFIGLQDDESVYDFLDSLR